MRSVLVQLDNETYRALNKVAPPAQRKRIEFIRRAIKEAIRREEYQKIRRAYQAQPDSSADADAWSNPEEFAI
jgi:metal-responsive CopG/Arc/MetJ family transcriptional regulator